MATNTSTTTQTHNGTGSQNNFAISFPFLANSEVEVTVGGVLKTLGNHYNIVGSEVQFTAGNTPPNVTANIIFNRDTNISAAKVDFTDGSVLTEIDLDNNGNQVLFAQQEIINDYVKRDGSQTITGNLVFEGATNDNNETTLAITDPTADRTITIPDITGTVVTTGDTGTVTSTMITNNTIVDADVNASAAIQGTKINPNFGSQNIATTGNTTIGGTLGVTGSTTVGGTLEVTGTSTFTGAIDANGGASIDNIQIGVTGDNEIDTASGNLTIDSAGGTTTIDDALTVSGNATLQGTLGVTSNTTVGGTLGVTSNTTVGGTLGVTGTTTVPNITGDAVVTSGTSTSDTKVYSAKRAGEIFYGKDTVEEIQSGETWSSADDKVATTAAIDARIIDLVDDVGGFVPIANETVFPNANPDINDPATGGTIVSIKEIGSSRTPSSGTVTISNGNVANNATITITGCGSTVLAAGFGVLVETTSTIHTYAFHRLVPKATEVTTVAGKATEIGRLGTAAAVEDLSILGTADVVSDLNTLGTADVVSDMNALAVSDVISDMNTLAVTSVINDMDTVATNVTNVNNVGGSIANVNTTAGSIANVNTVAGSIGNVNTVGAAITNVNNVGGSIANVNTVATNLSSVNSFANTYRIGSSNPDTSLDVGDLFFNTTTDSLKVYTGSAWVDGVTQTGNFALKTGNTFTGDNLYNDNVLAKFGTDSDLAIYYNSTSDRSILASNGARMDLRSDSVHITSYDVGETMATFTDNGAVELYYDNSKKFETTSVGVNVTGNVILPDSSTTNDGRIKFGAGTDMSLYHYGGANYIDIQNTLNIRGPSSGGATINIKPVQSENGISVIPDGAVELYHDNVKALETINLSATRGVKIGQYINIYRSDYGNGNIQNTSGNLYIEAKAGETAAVFKADGAVELNFDNSKKFETTSGGVSVTGQIISTLNFRGGDDVELSLGDAEDLKLDHDGTNSHIVNTTGELRVRGNDVRLMNSAGNEHYFVGFANGYAAMYYDNTQRIKTTSTGGQVTGNLRVNGHADLYDDERLRLGASADLQIYHDGSDSFITNQTGTLKIQTQVNIDKSDGSEHLARFIPDGAVELYYDGSKKFETNSGGCTLTGTLTTTSGINAGNNISMNDNIKLKAGTGDDLQIYHDSSSNKSIIKETGTGSFDIQGNWIQILNEAGNENKAVFKDDGAVELYYDNSKKLETTGNGIILNGASNISHSSADNLQVGTGSGSNGITIYSGSDANGSFYFADGSSGDAAYRGFIEYSHSSDKLYFGTAGSTIAQVSIAGFLPNANNTYDLGNSSYRWRNIYTNDLNLSNEGSSNDVDGTWGSYTIQEGAEDLFLVNKRNGKKYKFALTEVS